MALVPRRSEGGYREEDEERGGARAVFGRIRERETDARQRLPRDVQADPDRAARARKAALFTGGSPEAIERSLPEMDERERVNAITMAMDANRRMREFLTRDGMVRVAHDDVEALASIADTFDRLEARPADQERARDWSFRPEVLPSGAVDPFDPAAQPTRWSAAPDLLPRAERQEEGGGSNWSFSPRVGEVMREVADRPAPRRPNADLEGVAPDEITRVYQENARRRTNANRAADGFFSAGAQFFQRGLGMFEGGLFSVAAALQDWSANTPLPFYSDEVNERNRQESLAKRDQLRLRAIAANSGGEIAGEVDWQEVKDNPGIGTGGAFILQQGVQSLPQMAAAVFALPSLVVSQSGNIGQQRAENNGEDFARLNDVLVASPFAVASSLLDRVGAGSILSNTGKGAARRIITAGATEAGTEFVQSGLEYGGGTIGTEAGFDPYEALDQSLAGAFAGGGIGAGMRGSYEITQSAAIRTVEYVQARAGERLMGDIFAKAGESKLRLRDPDLFAEFLSQQTNGSVAENLYVPAETLRSLYQDENGSDIERGDDAVNFEDFVPNFWDQFNQASATGGDIVIPMSKAAAYLAGTPEWDIIKGDARVAPGGLSPNEARALEDDWAGTIEDMGRRAYASAQADLEADGPRQRVYNSVLSQARQAGFSLNASRAYADLWAERYQARAERLGSGADAFTLFEASVAGINQAMPGAVETYRRGDNLDVLINAMRRGAEDMKPEGEPLLDRIIRGGGIIDKGGDIRSMGGGKVQKGGYFGRRREPLIRDYDETGDMLGGGSNAQYGLDDWALTLWEEGYFPYAQERPSTNDLLDLIGDALRGVDVRPEGSASPAVEANNAIVLAADDLRNLLFNAGLDPDTATREEIEATIDQAMGDEGGYGFAQAPLAQETADGKPLVTVHNLSEVGLRNAQEIGGLAAPSLAVIRADIEFNNFGEITLIADPRLVDPKSERAARAFNADVYSPRQPRAQFDLHKPTLDKLQSDMREALADLGRTGRGDFDADMISRDGLSAIEQSDAAKLTFLRSIGQNPRIIRDEKPKVDKRLAKFAKGQTSWNDVWQLDGFEAAVLEVEQERIAALVAADPDIDADRIRLRTFDFGGPNGDEIVGVSDNILFARAREAMRATEPAPVNGWQTGRALEKKINSSRKRAGEYRKWVQDNYAGVIAGAFFEPRDSGRRRDYTMENLVREMTRTIRDGEGFNYGLGSLRSNVARQFRTLAAIKEARGDIVTDADMEAVKKEVGAEMDALAAKFAPLHGSGQDFGWLDIFSQFLKDIARGRPSDLREWQTEIFKEPASDELLQEAREFLAKLRDLPTEYFEVKMQRAVGFDEFTAAVVPDNADPETIATLRSYGLRIEKYPAGKSRVEAIMKAAGTRSLFQPAFHGSPHTFDAFSTDFEGTGEGAAAFGWGLYFSGSREIADWYREALSTGDDNFIIADTGEVFNPARLQHVNMRVAARKNGTDIAASVARARELLANANDTTRPMLKEDLAILSEIEERGGLKPPGPGRLYEVNIPEDDDFLLWDKPLSEQSNSVMTAFAESDYEATRARAVEIGAVAGYSGDWRNDTGEEAYSLITSFHMVERGLSMSEAQREASRALWDAGIAGAKYQAGQLSDATPPGQFNYVVYDASAVTIARMEQEGSRGRIDFLADKRATITLFENRDMSTLLHEGGHLWLEELRSDALSLQSSSVFADWETVKAWMKRETGLEIADGEPIPTEAHELWARAMERYFMEGKAPSEGLRSAFASFRAWLVRIYKRVTGLNANIDDEVRAVFDRLIATDEAIALAQRESNDRALFEDAEAAGMTDAEFKAYTDLVSESRTEAFDKLLLRTMDDVRKARTVEYKERRSKLRIQVEREIKARPEWQAIDLLRGNGDEYMPVAKESVIQRVGNDAWELLPYGRPGKPTFTNEAYGFDADIVAERAGFDTGTQMLEALMGIGMRRTQLREAGDRRTVLDEAIDVETDRLMQERYGDDLSNGSIEEEALALIHSDAGAARLAAEVRQLAIRAGEAPAPEDAIRAWAERIVGEARVVDQASGAAVERHRKAEAKASRAAEQAYLNGDFQTAFREKQRQQIAGALLRASRNARERVDVIGRKLDRYSRSRGYKGMAPDYLDRIHELLEQYDLRQRTEKSLREREAFDKWAARQREMGIDVQVPARLTLAGEQHFTRLTFDEVVALDDAVESLANLGRQKMRLKTEQEERDLEAMVGEAVQAAQALPTRPWDGERNQARNIPRELNAALVKMEFIADYLDDGNSNGVFNEVLVKGATRSANKLEELQQKVMGPLARLYLDMPGKEKRRFSERISVPEFVSVDPATREVRPTTFMRSELIAVALNVGNRSNLEKMLEGETKAIEAVLGERGAAPHMWTEEKVMAVLNRHLSESDWQFVETVWQQVNVLWPDIVETERELTGITPEKVQGRPVETMYGTIEGGYYPVVYDPNRSQMASDNADQEAADIFGSIGRFVSTPKGHTVSRTNAAMPITFSLERVLFSHVKKVSTRIAYGRYVRDTMKFAAHPKVRKIFDDHLGMEYHKQIKPWLSEQVQDGSMDLKHLAALDRILRQFRVNMTLVGLGFRFTTMFAQVAGWHNSQAEIGSKWLARGAAEMFKNMGSVRSFVFERSAEMASRAQAFDRDVRQFYQQASEGGRREGNAVIDKASRLGQRLGVPKVQAAAFWGISMIDVYMVAMPTWLGAYYKALDAGMSEGQAIDAGDKAVRKSQSAGRAKDLSAVQRGPEGMRVLTTFYSYFNVLYNKQFETASLVKKGREAGRRGDKAMKFAHWRQAAMNVWWIMLIAPVTSALLTGDAPDEDERDLDGLVSWAMTRIFFSLWAGVPGVRDISSKAQREIQGDYAGSVTSPFFTAFEAAERPIDDLTRVARGDEPSERWIKNAIVAPGYFLGLPTGQLGSTTQYLVDVGEGDQNPDDVGDVVYGIMKGPQEDQE